MELGWKPKGTADQPSQSFSGRFSLHSRALDPYALSCLGRVFPEYPKQAVVLWQAGARHAMSSVDPVCPDGAGLEVHVGRTLLTNPVGLAV